MLKSEMQHQFWITKKAVQRKLGSKEDEHIISSDSELDAKIEIFKSIAETSANLNKIIDIYQERLCILSQEECLFGRFLKEVGKRSKTTGVSITNTGKAVSYCGQQRMCVRAPLLRLQHEVDVFINQAVRDTQSTIQIMEKERTEYRAALSWMKSASTELDPDTGRGLEKFRTAQYHVRNAKRNFDSLSMDSNQKIDLLTAARCNMYSHALASYLNELHQFAKETFHTFQNISASIMEKAKYDFFVLKDLVQDDKQFQEITAIDKEQSLFFAEDFSDEKLEENLKQHHDANMFTEANARSENVITPDTFQQFQQPDQESSYFSENMANQNQPLEVTKCNATSPSKLYNILNCDSAENGPSKVAKSKSESTKTTRSNAWIDIFAELDPLVNPLGFKFNDDCNNSQQT